MSVVVNITHEVGDFSEYTSSSGKGDMSVTVGAGLGGTGHGINVPTDDHADKYVYKQFTQATTIRTRFYIDPNTLTMANGDNFTAFRMGQGSPTYDFIFIVRLEKSGANYQLQLIYRDDAGTLHYLGGITITDAPHYVEVNEVQAATNISSDGTIQYWIDGTDKGITTGIDNYNYMHDAPLRANSCAFSISAGTSGAFFVDEIIVNDDGGLIGPVASSPTLNTRKTLLGVGK